MNLTASIERTRARREIKRMLLSLPEDIRMDALVEVLEELGALRTLVTELAPTFATSPAPAEALLPGTPQESPPARTGSARPRGGISRIGRPPSEHGYKARLLRKLAEQPHMSIADLAQHIYGNTERHSRDKVRSLLSVMNGRQVRRVGEGQWEVIPQPPEAG